MNKIHNIDPIHMYRVRHDSLIYFILCKFHDTYTVESAKVLPTHGTSTALTPQIDEGVHKSEC